MSSLSWMPMHQENSAGPPKSLRAFGPTNDVYTVRPIISSDDAIEEWSLIYQSDDETEELGHFDDAVTAQLHAERHHQRPT